MWNKSIEITKRKFYKWNKQMLFRYELCQRRDRQHKKEAANDVLPIIELLKENLDIWKEEDTEECNTA